MRDNDSNNTLGEGIIGEGERRGLEKRGGGGKGEGVNLNGENGYALANPLILLNTTFKMSVISRRYGADIAPKRKSPRRNTTRAVAPYQRIREIAGTPSASSLLVYRSAYELD